MSLKQKQVIKNVYILQYQPFKLSFVFRYTVEAPTEGPLGLTTGSMNMTTVTTASPPPPPSHPPREDHVCHKGLCLNGGTCHQLQLPGKTLPSCHCPLNFTGTLCEKGT